MRLVSIKLSGFRGFPGEQFLDLDAAAIVVIGANGHGKTSLFDGILWGLTGRIPRLGDDDSRFISMYSESGQARVELRLQEERTGDSFTVIRSSDGKERRLTLENRERTYQGPSAEGELINLIWPDVASAAAPSDALASLLTCSTYLQQDLIREFVEAASDQERFTAVSELVGAGRVTELQGGMERSKKAWSAITNQRAEELHPLRERLAMIQSRVLELTSRSSQDAINSEDWDRWWKSLSELDLNVEQVAPSARDASTAIDTAVKQLEALRHRVQRRQEVLQSTLREMDRLSQQNIPDLVSLRQSVMSVRNALEETRVLVASEQTRLAERRRYQTESNEKNEQLRALASLALRHLTDHCPVCSQTYDQKATRERLEAIVISQGTESQELATPDKLGSLLADSEAREKELSAAELSLQSAQRAFDERERAKGIVSKRLADIGLGELNELDRIAVVARAIEEAETLLQRVLELQRVGEAFALRLAQSSAMAAIEELRREESALRPDIILREVAIADRNKTGELAQRVIEALREAASSVVEERLREISPLFQSFWSRIDPHPSFRVVSFFSQVLRGKGQLGTAINDPLLDKICELPAAVLSSSQLNALAVSVFLSLNIGVQAPPLSVAILDDPLQSLDDINLLGLVDLFRRTKERRQFIVSTHDVRFGGLLARKLRPSDDKSRTIVIELNTWGRQGPTVSIREVICDPVALRLVS